MITKIYALIDPRSCEVRWVGKTCQKWVSSRMTRHRDAARGYTRAVGCTPWIKELLDAGLDARVVILEETEEWVEAERFWIAYFKYLGADLMNLSDGGDGGKGHVPSLATRRRYSVARMGHEVTSETREKLSAAFTGRIIHPEWREKIRRARALQAPISLESRRKISDALKGRPKPPRSAEHAAAISRAHTGRPGRKWTEEEKMRSSLRQKGRIISDEAKDRMRNAALRRHALKKLSVVS